MDPSVGSRGPLFDDKLDHISFQKLFWSINHLVKVSHKNWSTFLLQKTDFVQALTEEFTPVVESYRQLGLFPPAVTVASDASPQTKLLAMVGRD